MQVGQAQHREAKIQGATGFQELVTETLSLDALVLGSGLSEALPSLRSRSVWGLELPGRFPGEAPVAAQTPTSWPPNPNPSGGACGH